MGNMENKVYIIVSGEGDYGALNYEDSSAYGKSLKELNQLTEEELEEMDFTFELVEDIIPNTETESLIATLMSNDVIDYDAAKHKNIYLIDKE